MTIFCFPVWITSGLNSNINRNRILFLFSVKLSLAEPDGLLSEEVGCEIESILISLFTTTVSVKKGLSRLPPTKERRCLTSFVQVSQKPFFNPRIPAFTGIDITIIVVRKFKYFLRSFRP
jgi:hypothetical protein